MVSWRGGGVFLRRASNRRGVASFLARLIERSDVRESRAARFPERRRPGSEPRIRGIVQRRESVLDRGPCSAAEASPRPVWLVDAAACRPGAVDLGRHRVHVSERSSAFRRRDLCPSDAVSSPIETMPRPDELAPDPPPETAEPDPDLSPDPEWREPGETAPEGRVWIGPRSVPLETWRAVPIHEADPRDRQPTDPSERADASPPSEPAPAPRIPDRPNDAAPTAPVKAYVPAEPLSDNPTPEYPRLARRKGMEGVVLVRAHVSPTGSVLAVSVSRSSGHRSLDEAAVSCVRRWTFDPALDRGEPVEGLVEFPIRFRLKGGR